MTMSINELIERSSHCVVTDGAGNVHFAVKAKIEDLRAIEQEIARLKEIEHLAWHVCEGSHDAPLSWIQGHPQYGELLVDEKDLKALSEALSEEHPE